MRVGSTLNVYLSIMRKKVGRIKEGVDNKFVRHAVELTIDEAVIPLGSRYSTKKPASHRSCPPVCLSAVLLYTLSRLFSYSSSLSALQRESSLNHCPLISRRQRHRRRGVQEKGSSSRLSSRFPLNFDSAFFCWRSGPRETVRRAGRAERMISSGLMKRRSRAKSPEESARARAIKRCTVQCYGCNIVLHGRRRRRLNRKSLNRRTNLFFFFFLQKNILYIIYNM